MDSTEIVRRDNFAEPKVDAKKFIDNLRNSEELLSRAVNLLYASREIADGKETIKFAFNTVPSTHVEYFNDKSECDLWWNEFVRMLSELCKPPCISVYKTLFQPHYLRRIMCFSDERAHFVVLDFGNARNLALGYKDKWQQIDTYNALCEVLGSRLLPPDKPRKV